MDQNRTNAVDNRIAKVIARRAGASSSETFEIIREDGTEPLRNRVGAGQIDSTVACSQFKEPEKPKGFKPADELDANAAPRNVSTTLRHRGHAFTVEPRT